MKKALYIVSAIATFLGLAFLNDKYNLNIGKRCAKFVQNNADRVMSWFDKNEQTENTSSEEAAGETAS